MNCTEVHQTALPSNWLQVHMLQSWVLEQTLGTSADSDELYCGTSDGSTVKLAAGTHASVMGAGTDAEDSECSVAVGSALLGTSADSDELYCGTSDGSTIKLAAGTHASVMGAGADAGDPGCSVAVGSALSAAEENPLLVIRL